ncbi:ribonuclease H-like domain-containing protein [Tanacetum coccineum]
MFTCTLAQYVAHKTNVAQQFTPQKHYRLPHLGQGILGPAPAIYSQPTTLPSAFSIMPPQDPTWHMDTDTSHLNFNASNLSIIFDKRLFSSVSVGIGKSIPVTNIAPSINHFHHPPFHLHNFLDYLTRHILLRCDSSGDLYPVTKPSTLPIAFLSTSASTWHQRLGHPGVNMVRSMWLFKHKFHADGTLSRYKARLVANGSSQQLGVDFDETFSLVVKPATIPLFARFLALLCLRSLYGLKQAPRAWFQRFAGYATRAGFYHSRCDSSLFIYRQGSQVAYLLLYVDDIILTASSTTLLQQLIDSLHREFDMTDLGALNYFLGISAVRHSTGLFLSQRKYDLQLLELAHMVNCNPSRTQVDTESKLGTLDLGLHLYASSTTSLVGYTDADWAGCPSTHMSTSGYCVFLGDNLLSWSAKRQHTLSRSSAEAEYRGVANVVVETAWLRNILCELHSPLSTATLVYCDNISAVYMSANPVQHQRTKHIEIDIHFVRDMVTAGQVRVLHVPSRYQYADIFTKGLPSVLFEEFRSSLSVRPPPAPTARAY